MRKIGTDLKQINCGLCNLFLQHTSCALSINENACSDVQRDLSREMDRVFPDDDVKRRFEHSYEGPDDMSAHCKSSVLGVSLNIPITNGSLSLGTWQGIYLLEARDEPSSRTIVVTIHGE
ncbi:hypothetical protein P9112_008781 [Eukaryota sp. TZLM1-RC]